MYNKHPSILKAIVKYNKHPSILKAIMYNKHPSILKAIVMYNKHPSILKIKDKRTTVKQFSIWHTKIDVITEIILSIRPHPRTIFH